MLLKFCVLFFVFVALPLPKGDCITVFECAHPQSSLTSYSATKVQPCVERPASYNKTDVHLQLLRENKRLPVDYMGCYASLHSTLSYCGMHSHSSIMDHIEVEVPLTREACYSLVTGNKITILGKEVGPFMVGTTSKVNMVMHGSVNQRTGYCQGETFIWNGMIRENAVSFDVLTVGVYQGQAKWDLTTDTLTVPHQADCQHGALRCRSASHGDLHFFTRPGKSCDSTDVSELYRGPAKLISSANSETYLLVDTKVRTFAVAIQDTFELCDRKVHKTNIGNVFALISDPRDVVDSLNKENTLPTSDALIIETMSKVLVLDRETSNNLNNQVIKIEYELCKQRYEHFQSLLSIAAIDPDEFAYLITGGPGFQAVRRGEIIYLVKCTPLEVGPWKAMEECYDELPVNVSGKLLFAKPKSRVLVDKGTQVDCDNLMPVGHLINGDWYTPSRLKIAPPKVLNPSVNLNISFDPILAFGTSGVYTEDEIHKKGDRILFDEKQDVVNNILARQVIGMSVAYQGLSLFSGMAEKDVETLGSKIFSSAYKTFFMISNVTAGIIGLCFIWTILKGIWIFISNVKLLNENDKDMPIWQKVRTARSNRDTTLHLIRATNYGDDKISIA